MNAFVANECAASMREIKNRQGKEEVVNISIPRFYGFSFIEAKPYCQRVVSK